MSEFERIDLFLRSFREAGGPLEHRAVVLGPGDDAAIVDARRPLAITTDAVVEDVHFRRAWATAEQIGHKALAVNLSDLAAMGACPTAFTCALVVPDDVDDEFLLGLARGMAPLARRHGCALVGGNFSRGEALSLTITALGELDGPALRRDRARPGDLVMLVGDVGVAGAELALLENHQPLPEGRSALLEPEPLVDAGLAAARLVACGLDVSDGLAQDAGHLARASAVRICLDFQSIPRTSRFDLLCANLTEAERASLLVAGGEDYALVLAGSADAAAALGAAIIGRVEEGAGVTIDHLPPGARVAGHDHFR